MRHGLRAIVDHRGEPSAPLVVAHRGDWRGAAQNSLAAFEEAVRLGCDAVELDVRRTADGVLVVVHDRRIAWRQINRMTVFELRRLSPDGYPALLQDVLISFAGRIGLDIELKEAGHEAQVMALVRRYLSPEQYVVTSFREGVLRAVSAAAPEARTGLLLGRLPRRMAIADVDFLAAHARLARAGLLGWATSRRIPCWVWTVNEPRTLQALTGDPRVEAIITDRPDRALAARSAIGGADR